MEESYSSPKNVFKIPQFVSPKYPSLTPKGNKVKIIASPTLKKSPQRRFPPGLKEFAQRNN